MSPGIDSKEPIPLANVAWTRICKPLRSPGIDSKEPIPLANVAWARMCKRLRSPHCKSEGLRKYFYQVYDTLQIAMVHFFGNINKKA